MDLLPIIVLLQEYKRGVSSPFVRRKVLCLQQSPNCCTMSHLTLDQRYQIAALRHEKPAEIARKIGKHRSVICRELARNAPTRAEYKPQTAHQSCQQRKAKNAQKATPAMYEVIREGLQNEWSPDQISGRSQIEGQPMVSRAAIYTHIWRDQRQGGTLYKHLRHAHKPYRKRYGKPDGRTKAAKRASKPSIDQRPAIVDAKSRFGD